MGDASDCGDFWSRRFTARSFSVRASTPASEKAQMPDNELFDKMHMTCVLPLFDRLNFFANLPASVQWVFAHWVLLVTAVHFFRRIMSRFILPLSRNSITASLASTSHRCTSREWNRGSSNYHWALELLSMLSVSGQPEILPYIY